MRRNSLCSWAVRAACIGLFACISPYMEGAAQGQQWTRPSATPENQAPTSTYKLGRLTENPQKSLNPAPYVIQEGTFGGRFFVMPAEDLELSQFMNQEIVVRGSWRPTSNPRHKLLVVDRVFNRSPARVSQGSERPIRPNPSGHSLTRDDEPLGKDGEGGGEPMENADERSTEIANRGAPREINFADGRPLRSLEEAANDPVDEPYVAVERDVAVAGATAVIGSGLAANGKRPPADWASEDVFGDRKAASRQTTFQTQDQAQEETRDGTSRSAETPPDSDAPRAGNTGELPPPILDRELHGGHSPRADHQPQEELGDRMGDTYFDRFDIDDGACPECGSPTIGGACRRGCGSPEWIWIRGEYLLWWTSGLDVPPLITTSPNGTARGVAGVLDEAGTSNLFGGGDLNNTSHSGFRVRTGKWLGPAKRWGVEGEYLRIDDQQANFNDTSGGDPILARPVYDIVAGQEAAQLIAFPSVIRGTVDAEAITRFQAAGARFRWNLWCSDLGCVPDTCPRTVDGYRVDWFAGYRYARLNDQITVTEDLTSLDPQDPGTSWIQDQFLTGNEFHGGDIGFIYEQRTGPWLVDCLTRLAIGNNHQVVNINGSSIITDAGSPQTYTGGLLAQRSNIGFYTRDELAVIPELGLTLGYQLTGHTRLTCGYSFLYFSNVVRAGDQIDLDVNPNLIPPEANPFTGPLRPAFEYRTTDFWAHGLNLGFDVRF